MAVDPRHVQAIFLAAVGCADLAERAKKVNDECGDDQDLRRRIEALLKAHDQSGELPAGALLVERPTGERTIIGSPSDSAGTVIAGRYKLLEMIGEGGMGSVWVVQQSEPIRRRVALKLIKPGMDTRQVLSRFELERQALALMDHPNIAKVLDAGVTEHGRPFFAMEYVKGVPITDYCNEARLTIEERLQLFVPVCQAVQHAHQKGIIHRDLKPSNILVCLYDGQPVPKVIDFGLAKAIHQPLIAETLYTAHGLMVGTPLYMSPEQAEFNNLDIDTRTDVYSLGVVLYELLTGTTPLQRQQFKDAALQEMLRLIKEEEPEKPSTKLSGGATLPAVATQRRLEPAQLRKVVRGELDWIVMKSLEKERSRRYETANGLARDIERFLDDQPVEAGPPSSFYRVRKFARRNRTAFLTSTVVLASLLIGIVVSTMQAIRATRAERLAQSRLEGETEARSEAERAQVAEAEQRKLAESRRIDAEKSRALADTNARQAQKAVDEYFTLVSESQLLDVPGLQPLRKKLLESALKYYERLGDQPRAGSGVRAELAATRLRIAQVYEQNNRIDDSIREMSRALDIIDALRKQTPQQAGFPKCFAGFRKTGRIVTFFTLWPADPQQAIRVASRAAALWEEFMREHPQVVGFRSDLASFYSELSDVQYYVGDKQGAMKSVKRSQEILEQLIAEMPEEPEHRARLADVLEYESRNLRQINRVEEGEKLLRRALAIQEKLVAEHPNTTDYQARYAYSFIRLGHVLDQRGRPAEALAAFEGAVDRWRKLQAQFPTIPGFRKRLTQALHRAAEMQYRTGRIAEGERNFREAVQLRSKLAVEDPGEKGDNLSELAEIHLAWGSLLEQFGKRDEAREHLQLGLAAGQKCSTLFPQDVDDAFGHECRTFAFAAWAKADVKSAEVGLRTALQWFEHVAQRHPQNKSAVHYVADTNRRLGELLWETGRRADAESALRQSVAIQEKRAAEPHFKPMNSDEWIRAYSALAALLAETGRRDEALQLHHRAAELIRRIAQDDPNANPATLMDLLDGDLAWEFACRTPPDSRGLEFAARTARSLVSRRPQDSHFWNVLGVAEYRTGHWESAETALDKSRSLSRGGSPRQWYFLAMTSARLGRKDQARKWFDAATFWTAMFAPHNVELASFRREAASLLGVSPEPLPQNVDEATLSQAIVNADPKFPDSRPWYVLSEKLMHALRWDEARRFTRAWLDREPDDNWAQFGGGAILAREGDLEDYRNSCKRLLARLAETDKPEWAERTAKVCLLLPPTGETLDAACRMADRAVRLGENTWVEGWVHVAASMAAYRRGNFREAVGWCDKALARESEDVVFRNAQAHYVRAMALSHLGQANDAKASLEKADGLVARLQSDGKADPGRIIWHNLAICEVLQREAHQQFAEPVKPAAGLGDSSGKR